MIHTFLGGGNAGFSADAHIEENMLLLDRMSVIGVRLAKRCLLLRSDIRDDLTVMKARIAELLRADGLHLIESQADLGDIAAIQIAGIRGGSWDLWGDDGASGTDALKRAVLGDDGPIGGLNGPMSDMGPGMTLEDLLGELTEGTDQ
ncbi:MAG: hypothetical protein ACR2L3_02565 [Actinomycetota bacterium]